MTLFTLTPGRADPSKGQAPAEAPKQLNTVPEDGLPRDDDSMLPRWLRDLKAKYPTEDLIVCMAGCSPHRDRIIYSRPAETTDVPMAAQKSSFVPTSGDAKPATPAPAGR